MHLRHGERSGLYIRDLSLARRQIGTFEAHQKSHPRDADHPSCLWKKNRIKYGLRAL